MNAIFLPFDGAPDTGARLVVTQVYARPGVGVSQLTFEMEIVTMAPWAGSLDMWLHGDLELLGVGGASAFLAPLRCEIEPISLPDLGGTRRITLVAEIHTNQLAAVEARREPSGEMRLALVLGGHWVRDGRPVVFWGRRVEHPIAQSDWIRILEQLEYKRILLLELDGPTPSSGSGGALAVRFFADAQDHYLEGEWRQTVESLRQALAAVGRDGGDKEIESGAAVKALRLEARKRPVGFADRLEPVRLALKFLCDVGGHPESGEPSRRDAYTALLMVAALLHGLAD